MPTRVATLQVDQAIIPDLTGIVPVTFVAIPPDEDDAAASKIRVYAGGVLTLRDYDPDIDA